MKIPEKEHAKILAIAREVRKHVVKHSGVACIPTALCGEASLALSTRLTREKIRHQIWGGVWRGPIDIAGEALDVEFGKQGDHRLHTWIVFPQYEDAILDVTADQFTQTPDIWFPADKRWYTRTEKFDANEIFETAMAITSLDARELEEEARIPLSGPRYRRPLPMRRRRVNNPMKIQVRDRSFKIRVRNHLRRPPQSCLCHRSKAVNRVRKSMVRRLS